MARTLTIKIDASGAVTGGRLAEKAIDGVGDAATELDKKTQRMQGSLNRAAKTMQSAGRNMSLYLTTPLTALSVLVLRTAGNFEEGMNRVQAVSGATRVQMAALSTEARRLGAETRFSAEQAADALGFLAMAGFGAEKSLSSLEGTLQLAAAAQLGLGQSADIVSNILTGFALNTEDLTRVNDVLVNTFTTTNTNLVQLGEAFKFVGPIAASAGVTIEETAAAIGLLGNAGLQATLGGTALRGMFTRLLSPSNEAKEILDEFGISAVDAHGKLLPLTDILRQLGPLASDTARLMAVFGERAGPGVAALLSQGVDALEDQIERVKQSGTAARVAEIQMQGLNAKLDALSSAFSELQLAIADAGLLEFATNGATSLANFTRELAKLDPAVLSFATALTALTALTGPLLLFAGATAKALAALAVFAAPAAMLTGIGAVVIALSGLFAIVQKANEQDFSKISNLIKILEGQLPGLETKLQAAITKKDKERIDLFSRALEILNRRILLAKASTVQWQVAVGTFTPVLDGFLTTAKKIPPVLGEGGEKTGELSDAKEDLIAAFEAEEKLLHSTIDIRQQQIQGLIDEKEARILLYAETLRAQGASEDTVGVLVDLMREKERLKNILEQQITLEEALSRELENFIEQSLAAYDAMKQRERAIDDAIAAERSQIAVQEVAIRLEREVILGLKDADKATTQLTIVEILHERTLVDTTKFTNEQKDALNANTAAKIANARATGVQNAANRGTAGTRPGDPFSSILTDFAVTTFPGITDEFAQGLNGLLQIGEQKLRDFAGITSSIASELGGKLGNLIGQGLARAMGLGPLGGAILGAIGELLGSAIGSLLDKLFQPGRIEQAKQVINEFFGEVTRNLDFDVLSEDLVASGLGRFERTLSDAAQSLGAAFAGDFRDGGQGILQRFGGQLLANAEQFGLTLEETQRLVLEFADALNFNLVDALDNLNRLTATHVNQQGLQLFGMRAFVTELGDARQNLSSYADTTNMTVDELTGLAISVGNVGSQVNTLRGSYAGLIDIETEFDELVDSNAIAAGLLADQLDNVGTEAGIAGDRLGFFVEEVRSGALHIEEAILALQSEGFLTGLELKPFIVDAEVIEQELDRVLHRIEVVGGAVGATLIEAAANGIKDADDISEAFDQTIKQAILDIRVGEFIGERLPGLLADIDFSKPLDVNSAAFQRLRIEIGLTGAELADFIEGFDSFDIDFSLFRRGISSAVSQGILDGVSGEFDQATFTTTLRAAITDPIIATIVDAIIKGFIAAAGIEGIMQPVLDVIARDVPLVASGELPPEDMVRNIGVVFDDIDDKLLAFIESAAFVSSSVGNMIASALGIPPAVDLAAEGFDTLISRADAFIGRAPDLRTTAEKIEAIEEEGKKLREGLGRLGATFDAGSEQAIKLTEAYNKSIISQEAQIKVLKDKDAAEKKRAFDEQQAEAKRAAEEAANKLGTLNESITALGNTAAGPNSLAENFQEVDDQATQLRVDLRALQASTDTLGTSITEATDRIDGAVAQAKQALIGEFVDRTIRPFIDAGQDAGDALSQLQTEFRTTRDNIWELVTVSGDTALGIDLLSQATASYLVQVQALRDELVGPIRDSITTLIPVFRDFDEILADVATASSLEELQSLRDEAIRSATEGLNKDIADARARSASDIAAQRAVIQDLITANREQLALDKQAARDDASAAIKAARDNADATIDGLREQLAVHEELVRLAEEYAEISAEATRAFTHAMDNIVQGPLPTLATMLEQIASTTDASELRQLQGDVISTAEERLRQTIQVAEEAFDAAQKIEVDRLRLQEDQVEELIRLQDTKFQAEQTALKDLADTARGVAEAAKSTREGFLGGSTSTLGARAQLSFVQGLFESEAAAGLAGDADAARSAIARFGNLVSLTQGAFAGTNKGQIIIDNALATLTQLETQFGAQATEAEQQIIAIEEGNDTLLRIQELIDALGLTGTESQETLQALLDNTVASREAEEAKQLDTSAFESAAIAELTALKNAFLAQVGDLAAGVSGGNPAGIQALIDQAEVDRDAQIATAERVRDDLIAVLDTNSKNEISALEGSLKVLIQENLDALQIFIDDRTEAVASGLKVLLKAISSRFEVLAAEALGINTELQMFIDQIVLLADAANPESLTAAIANFVGALNTGDALLVGPAITTLVNSLTDDQLAKVIPELLTGLDASLLGPAIQAVVNSLTHTQLVTLLPDILSALNPDQLPIAIAAIVSSLNVSQIPSAIAMVITSLDASQIPGAITTIITAISGADGTAGNIVLAIQSVVSALAPNGTQAEIATAIDQVVTAMNPSQVQSAIGDIFNLLANDPASLDTAIDVLISELGDPDIGQAITSIITNLKPTEVRAAITDLIGGIGDPATKATLKTLIGALDLGGLLDAQKSGANVFASLAQDIADSAFGSDLAAFNSATIADLTRILVNQAQLSLNNEDFLGQRLGQIMHRIGDTDVGTESVQGKLKQVGDLLGRNASGDTVRGLLQSIKNNTGDMANDLRSESIVASTNIPLGNGGIGIRFFPNTTIDPLNHIAASTDLTVSQLGKISHQLGQDTTRTTQELLIDVVKNTGNTVAALNAMGGHSFPAILAEQGLHGFVTAPAFPIIAHQGERVDVFTAKETARGIGAGGGITININGGNSSPQQIANDVARVLRNRRAHGEQI